MRLHGEYQEADSTQQEKESRERESRDGENQETASEIYREEVCQRTRLAACARYIRRRDRRGCRLPSDALSPDELQQRCGPVRVFRGGTEEIAEHKIHNVP